MNKRHYRSISFPLCKFTASSIDSLPLRYSYSILCAMVFVFQMLPPLVIEVKQDVLWNGSHCPTSGPGQVGTNY